MKGIIIYYTKTGYTKNYASIISEKLGFELISYKESKKLDLSKYDIIIFGSRVNGARISKFKKFKKRIIPYKDKFILFTLGVTIPKAKYLINNMWNENLTESEIKEIPHFYFQGKLDYEKMGKVDSKIMRMVTKMIVNKKVKSKEDILLEKSLTSNEEINYNSNIKPLLDYVSLMIEQK